MSYATRFIDRLSRSVSGSFLTWTISFVAGIVMAALATGERLSLFWFPAWIGLLIAALLCGFFVKSRAARLMLNSLFCFAAGICRYASSGPEEPLILFPAIREGLMAGVSRALPEPAASFVTGLLVGDGNLPQELKQAFAATGTVHVMALSGWNLTVISDWLERALLRAPVSRKMRLAIVAYAAAFFTLATGAALSLVRAAVMALSGAVARAVGRPQAAGRAVFFAAAAILLVSPRAALDLGFLLSFSATLGLVFLSPAIAPCARFLPRRWKMRENAAATVAATAASLPITLVAFGRFSPFALPANVLLLPFIPPTMALGFASGLLALAWPTAGEIAGRLALIFVNYDFALVRIFSRIPGASLGGIAFGLIPGLLMAGLLAAAAIYAHAAQKHDQDFREAN